LNNIKENEMGEACSTNWIHEKCIQKVGLKTEEKRALGSYRCSWNIKINIAEIGCEDMDWRWLRKGASDRLS
jgi:hypothetical protein